MKMYMTYDSKVGIFSLPMFFKLPGEALRFWERVSNDPNTSPGSYPSDYTFFEVGSFNESTGQIKMLESKISIGTAIEFLKKSSPLPFPDFKQKELT